MNIQSVLSSLGGPPPEGSSQYATSYETQKPNPLDTISSMLPGGLAGGAAAGGLMALLMGSKSTRKIAKKVAAYGGTAVLGGLAYKAYSNWQESKSLGQTSPITDQDIEVANEVIPQQLNVGFNRANQTSLDLVLIKAMIAASKADGNLDAQEHQNLFNAIDKLNLSVEDKTKVFEFMSRDVTIDEIVSAVSLEEHKAEVYLSAYLAIEVDDQLERTFLNELALALALPSGLQSYLERQADQGVIT